MPVQVYTFVVQTVQTVILETDFEWMWSRALESKAKRMVLQCINGVGSNPVEGRKKI
jgi:hypothetical protein